MSSDTNVYSERSHLLVWSLVIVAAAAAGLTYFFPDVLRDTPMTVGNARGTALTILVVAIPTLIVALFYDARGSNVAPLFLLGGAGFLLYNSVIFVFGVEFNTYFLLYEAMFGFSIWSMLSLLKQLRSRPLAFRYSENFPRRTIAIYMILVAIIFYATWLADILPATIANVIPESLKQTHMITNPIHIVDLAVTLPLLLLAAVWLLRGRPESYPLGGSLLVMLTMESISVSLDQFYGHLHDPSQSLMAIPLMASLALIGIVMTTLFFRRSEYAPSAATQRPSRGLVAG